MYYFIHHSPSSAMFRECAYIWVGVGGESLGRSGLLLGFVRTSQPCLLPHDPYSDL